MFAKGIVKDATTGTTLPGVNVGVYNTATNQLVGGTTTNASGYFETAVLSGTYLKLSFIGFQDLVPVMRDDVLEQLSMQPTTYDVPTATATAQRTFDAIIYAIIAMGLIYLLLNR